MTPDFKRLSDEIETGLEELIEEMRIWEIEYDYQINRLKEISRQLDELDN